VPGPDPVLSFVGPILVDLRDWNNAHLGSCWDIETYEHVVASRTTWPLPGGNPPRAAGEDWNFIDPDFVDWQAVLQRFPKLLSWETFCGVPGPQENVTVNCEAQAALFHYTHRGTVGNEGWEGPCSACQDLDWDQRGRGSWSYTLGYRTQILPTTQRCYDHSVQLMTTFRHVILDESGGLDWGANGGRWDPLHWNMDRLEYTWGSPNFQLEPAWADRGSDCFPITYENTLWHFKPHLGWLSAHAVRVADHQVAPTNELARRGYFSKEQGYAFASHRVFIMPNHHLQVVMVTLVEELEFLGTAFWQGFNLTFPSETLNVRYKGPVFHPSRFRLLTAALERRAAPGGGAENDEQPLMPRALRSRLVSWLCDSRRIFKT